jgi:hypothetical protein
MNVSTTVRIDGVKDTINQLGKIDKQLQKQFKADATKIAEPALEAGRKSYARLANNSDPYALSGMSRNWKDKTTGRKLFPLKVANSIKGVSMKYDTRRRAIGVILVIQKDVATAVFETAGRKTSNKLGKSLGSIDSGKTRLLQPAVDGAKDKIEKELTQLIKDVTKTVQRGF